MSTLVRWNPARELVNMQRDMDRMFDAFFPTSRVSNLSNFDLAIDLVENEDTFVVTADLPGLKREDIEITFDQDVLTIKGETRVEEEREEAKMHIRERRFGSFVRSLRMPRVIDADNINADYTDGILKVTLPKTEEVKPRKISVNGSHVLESGAE